MDQPDLNQIAIKRAIGRVETEMQRRIEELFPVSRQLAILAGQLAHFHRLDNLTSEARRMAANDARSFPDMMNRISLFRAAADLQIRMLEAGKTDPNRTEFRADQYWKNCYD